MAGYFGLGNLIMFYDSNDIQLSTACDEVSDEDIAMKYKAWHWNVLEIDGNDTEQIRQALEQAQHDNGRPWIIIGKTIMGKGARRADNTSYECCTATHGAPLGGDAYVNTIKNLGGDIDNLVGGGSNISVTGSTIKLYPTRRNTENIFCTIE